MRCFAAIPAYYTPWRKLENFFWKFPYCAEILDRSTLQFPLETENFPKYLKYFDFSVPGKFSYFIVVVYHERAQQNSAK